MTANRSHDLAGNELGMHLKGRGFSIMPTAPSNRSGRYSPAQIQGTKTFCCSGKPDPAHISTSCLERQNLTMRMSMRRFTRLKNGFSKKAINHSYSVAIHFMHYNFVRIHQSLRITPAMAAGVTTKLWSLTDMVRVIEDWETARSAKTSGETLVG